MQPQDTEIAFATRSACEPTGELTLKQFEDALRVYGVDARFSHHKGAWLCLLLRDGRVLFGTGHGSLSGAAEIAIFELRRILS